MYVIIQTKSEIKNQKFRIMKKKKKNSQFNHFS